MNMTFGVFTLHEPHGSRDNLLLYMLEWVLRRAIKMIADFGHFSYHEILARLCMFSLSRRRMRRDMIVFKIFKGLDRIDPNKLFVVNVNNGNMGHVFKLYEKRFQK